MIMIMGMMMLTPIVTLMVIRILMLLLMLTMLMKLVITMLLVIPLSTRQKFGVVPIAWLRKGRKHVSSSGNTFCDVLLFLLFLIC